MEPLRLPCGIPAWVTDLASRVPDGHPAPPAGSRAGDCWKEMSLPAQSDPQRGGRALSRGSGALCVLGPGKETMDFPAADVCLASAGGSIPPDGFQVMKKSNLLQAKHNPATTSLPAPEGGEGPAGLVGRRPPAAIPGRQGWHRRHSPGAAPCNHKRSLRWVRRARVRAGRGSGRDRESITATAPRR